MGKWRAAPNNRRKIMKVSDFDYYLPAELIAQQPIEPRDAARLLVLHKASGEIEHKIFRDIIDYLECGDTLVLNDTRVIPARLFGIKEGGRAKVEIVLLKRLDHNTWEALVRPGKRLKPGARVIFGNGELIGVITDYTAAGGRTIKFVFDGVFEEILDRLGQMPLPPYIHAQLEDKERYQTVYSRERGSAAAPTAGLHFTTELLQQIKAKGVNLAFITLHVGLGTFRPVQVENIEEHLMHAEYYEVTPAAAALINQTRAKGKRVIVVGTTTARTLETVATPTGQIIPGTGWTDIFIYPGYQFKIVQTMLTNFHLPKSTLLMLISALAGCENVRRAYKVAVEERYRFFSFGDAMLII